jgi:DNA primase
MNTEVLNIAKQYLKKVKPSGGENVMAICPFHRKPDGSEETGPSFAMNVYNGLWFCHSCHAKGNFYAFLLLIGNTHGTIQQRYKYVLEEVGRHKPAPPYPMNPVEPTDAEPLHEGFLGLFNYYPQLMADEGFSQATCQKFGVGYDQLHQRITFPLRDLQGRLIGISGRTVINEEPRFKVYDTEYLDFGLPARKTEKRAIIWHGFETKKLLGPCTIESRPRRRAIVVEGFKAAMRVAEAGISTVVALLGSHMSDEQRWFLENLDADIYLMPDNDAPGGDGCLKSALRSIRHIPCLYLVEYEAPQPSDLFPEEVVAAVNTAKPFALWYAQQLAPGNP